MRNWSRSPGDGEGLKRLDDADWGAGIPDYERAYAQRHGCLFTSVRDLCLFSLLLHTGPVPFLTQRDIALRQMPAMLVAPQHHRIFASILNDFGQGRIIFTFQEFVQAARSIGFSERTFGELIPPKGFGNKLFHFMTPNGKLSRNVDRLVQDKWKVELFNLYGWTAETFRSA
ncbi:hypothetical protein LXA43DRAFT_1104418 [Ganoderma leucocontextum]|nr:hypothetical protein LXA43DRAFT_1104418 [Ganoderma leucocontextum]